jgi:hypothetical protein
MNLAILLALALSAAAPVPKDAEARDSAPAPTGPAPVFRYLKSDESGKISISRIRLVPIIVQAAPNVPGVTKYVPVAEVVLHREDGFLMDAVLADGTRVEPDRAKALLRDGVYVVLSPDGNPVAPEYLRMLRRDVLVISPTIRAGNIPDSQAIPETPVVQEKNR